MAGNGREFFSGDCGCPSGNGREWPGMAGNGREWKKVGFLDHCFSVAFITGLHSHFDVFFYFLSGFAF
jgi:hypothetical protein